MSLASMIADALTDILDPGSQAVKINTDPNKTCVKVSGTGISDDTYSWSTSQEVRNWMAINGVKHFAVYVHPMMVYVFPPEKKAEATLFKLIFGGS